MPVHLSLQEVPWPNLSTAKEVWIKALALLIDQGVRHLEREAESGSCFYFIGHPESTW